MADEQKAQVSATPDATPKAARVSKQRQGRNMAPAQAAKARTEEPIFGQDIQAHLGRTLKASYEEIVRQPVPDKIHELLKELQRREKN